MALISGFLKQTAMWTPSTSELDAYGQPVPATPQTIKVRWQFKAGFYSGAMGQGTGSAPLAYKNVVFFDASKSDVQAGDLLEYNGSGGKVIAIETYVLPSGKEAGRKCYV